MMTGNTRETFRTYLAQAWTHGVRDLILDIRPVGFANCVGLSIMLSIRSDWIGRGGHLRLLGPSRRLASLLVLVGLYAHFSCHPTLEEAVAGLLVDQELDHAA
jgi:anti-anti-sigma factor